jgi:hypothetical protein
MKKNVCRICSTPFDSLSERLFCLDCMASFEVKEKNFDDRLKVITRLERVRQKRRSKKPISGD